METFVTIMLIGCLLGAAVGAFMLIRNNFVYKCRSYALGMVDDYSHRLIAKVAETDPENTTGKMARWKEFFKILESYPEYDEMMKDIFNWKFETLFPDLEDRLKESYDMAIIGVPSFLSLVEEFEGKDEEK